MVEHPPAGGLSGPRCQEINECEHEDPLC
jgi:hypothetical protein